METVKNYIGKKVIIRSYGAGVFFGTLTEVEYSEGKMIVGMKNTRRLWYWDGAASISQIATEGVKRPDNCKFTVTVPSMVISDVLEIIPVSEESIVCLETVKVWKI